MIYIVLTVLFVLCRLFFLVYCMYDVSSAVDKTEE